jgi:WD domain, G-beta repeat
MSQNDLHVMAHTASRALSPEPGACRCGNFVYSGARRDPHILCWDVRYTGECLYRLAGHAADSAQRVGFDIEPSGRLLFAGGTDGHVRVYDLAEGSLVREVRVAEDTVSCVSVHPTLPLLLTASGHRRFAAGSDDDSGGSSDDGGGLMARECHGEGAAQAMKRKRGWELGPGRNELAIWQLQSEMVPEPEAAAQQHGGARDTAEQFADADEADGNVSASTAAHAASAAEPADRVEESAAATDAGQAADEAAGHADQLQNLQAAADGDG